MNATLSPSLLLRCFLRSYFVYAAYNSRGMQNIGFTYAIDPGLRAIHRSPGDLLAARVRYIRHYNCHPFWTPLLLGVFLHTEAAIAAGRLHPAAFTGIKDVTINTLSALGDSMFGGTLIVTWALSSALLISRGHPMVALSVSVSLFIMLQLFKLAGFLAGLSRGLSILFWLRKINLINWADMLKLINALLLVLFLSQALRPELRPGLWVLAMGAIILAAWLTSRVHFPRIVIALSTFAVALTLYAFST